MTDRWVLVGPHPESYARHWITRFVPPEGPTFVEVPPHYRHDDQRARTSLREWADVFSHARRGVQAAAREGAGVVALFPQLAAAVGLLARVRRRPMPVIAWSLNIGHDPGALRSRLAGAALARVGAMVVHSRREVSSYAAAFRLPAERFVFVPFSVEALVPGDGEPSAPPFALAMGSANRDYATLFDAVRELPIRLVVVAGAHGFVGGQVVRRLLAAPDLVPIPGSRTGRDGSRRVDVLSPDDLRRALGGVDAVVHCAVGDRAVTVDGTRNTLAAAADAGVRRAACGVRRAALRPSEFGGRLWVCGGRG